MIRLKLFLLFTLLILGFEVHAWNQKGHRIVAQIAQNHLSEKASTEVKRMLGHETLASVSSWADEMRSFPEWDHAKFWHYANMSKNNYLNSEINSDGDVITAIINCEDKLRSKNTPEISKINALKFLVHFMGDLHQPLHLGNKSDRGGNDVVVKWFKKKTNLHKVWDYELIDFIDLSYSEYTLFLDHYSDDEMSSYVNGTYVDWCNDTRVLTEKAYNYKSPNLEYKYISIFKNDMETKLRQAGIRLADRLNSIFELKPLSKKEVEMREVLRSKVKLKFKM